MGTINAKDLPCCPDLLDEPACERLSFVYALERRVNDVTVEIKITAMLERCPGPLALGDLVYSTTLLPGERVRLFSSSRRSRFTYDAETQVSYRHEQVSEETFYMSSVDQMMSNVTLNDSGSGGSAASGSFQTEGSTSGAIQTFFGGAKLKASGSFEGQSSYDFSREISQHARVSHERAVQATRAASAVQVGEVQSRTRIESESEQSYESSARTIANENRCHAVTYFAYQLNKTQTVRFRVEAVTLRVVNPAADTAVTPSRPKFNDLAVIPQGVLAASANRLAIENVARVSSAARQAFVLSAEPVAAPAATTPASAPGGAAGSVAVRARALEVAQPSRSIIGLLERQPSVPGAVAPVSTAARQAQALATVQRELADNGLIDARTGAVSDRASAEFNWERTSVLPTPAILVKACLDPCTACEPARQEEIKLDIERKRLENKLLERQIELLDRAQEYRCCPAGEHEDEPA